ncbi:unnamed protein product [Staurois parvus]|uniref:Uncharacterized protein n=1 Tax=Staurois parvus TaxID=386267 RepID=A0ABN9B6M1_9NEOB|nr:unnamed protein product [Staurois parvus]
MAAECGDGDSTMGGRTWTHEGSWTWQQQEEAVYRGPWQIMGPGSSYVRPT